LTVDNCNLITVKGEVKEIETNNRNVRVNQILGKVKTVNGNIKGAKS
jgi:hypothetical protein